MLILISPAKSLDLNPLTLDLKSTKTRLDKKSGQLSSKLRGQSLKSLRSLMKISKDLAVLNRDRYQDLHFPISENTGKQALFMFDGDVYKGMDPASMSLEQIAYTQDHVRILSGLYGVLRPLDEILPYRLEMGTRLAMRNKKNLYQFWGDDITELVNNDLEKLDEKIIVNLASQEYFDAINKEKLAAQVIDVRFEEMHQGEMKFISFFAKKARGLMSRYAADHSITKAEHLKNFDYEGYSFNEQGSSNDQWLFTR